MISSLSEKKQNIAPILEEITFNANPHHPKAGVNPLVDASASVFSTIGQLHKCHTTDNLKQIYEQLFSQIKKLQDYLFERNYSKDCILVTGYVLSATADHHAQKLLAIPHDSTQALAPLFSQHLQTDSFHHLLIKLTANPTINIDLLEFIYIAMSLGFSYETIKTGQECEQRDEFLHNLYRTIQRQRGPRLKTLTPTFSPTPKTSAKKAARLPWVIACILVSIAFTWGFKSSLQRQLIIPDFKQSTS